MPEQLEIKNIANAIDLTPVYVPAMIRELSMFSLVYS